MKPKALRYFGEPESGIPGKWEGENPAVTGNQGDFYVKSAVADGKADIFKFYVQPGLMQGGVANHIAVTHMAGDIVVAGYTVKTEASSW